jgi:hypothetical protein
VAPDAVAPVAVAGTLVCSCWLVGSWWSLMLATPAAWTPLRAGSL